MKLQIIDCKFSGHVMWLTDTIDGGEAEERIITACAVELQGRDGVKRTSYDIWVWKNLDEAMEFITYFTLKYNE